VVELVAVASMVEATMAVVAWVGVVRVKDLVVGVLVGVVEEMVQVGVMEVEVDGERTSRSQIELLTLRRRSLCLPLSTSRHPAPPLWP